MTLKTIIMTYDDTIHETTRNPDAVADLRHEISILEEIYIPMKTNLETKIKLRPDEMILHQAFLRIHYYFEYKLTSLKNRLNDETRELLTVDATILIDKDTTRKKKVIQDNLFKSIHEVSILVRKPTKLHAIQGSPKQYKDILVELDSFLFEIRCCEDPCVRFLYQFLFDNYHPLLLEINKMASEFGYVPRDDYWVRLCESIRLFIDIIQTLYQFQEYNV
jgi:hypothetical protein